MAERQPAEQHRIRFPRRRFLRGAGVADQVAVRQHHALGITGGARGIHDRGQVIRSEFRFPAVEFRVQARQCLPAALQERGPGHHILSCDAAVEDDDTAKRGQLVADLPNLIELGLCGDEQPAGPGIVQLEVDLPGR